MKCYLVTGEYPTLSEGAPEPYTRFLRIQKGDKGLGFYLADKFLPAGAIIAKDFERHFEQYSMGEPCMRAPFARFSDDDGPMRLVSVKPAERHADCVALVHVAVPCPNRGRMYLRANTYDEKLVEHPRLRLCVEREYKTMDSNPGVALVKDAEGNVIINQEHTEFLVTMYPKSSFRIHREPEERVDIPILVVAWSGARLRVFQPKNSKRKKSRGQSYSNRSRYRSNRPSVSAQA